jgi:hypothetical protein
MIVFSKKTLRITKGQSESLYRRRTDNTMAKRQKNRQYNDQKTEEQTIQWPKDKRTDNTMAKRQKNRQHNGQKTEEQTIQLPKEKGQKDKLRSTKHTCKTKNRVTRTPLDFQIFCLTIGYKINSTVKYK